MSIDAPKVNQEVNQGGNQGRQSEGHPRSSKGGGSKESQKRFIAYYRGSLFSALRQIQLLRTDVMVQYTDRGGRPIFMVNNTPAFCSS